MVCSIIFFNSNNTFSRSSKLLAFGSLQRHHIKNKWANLHMFKILRLPNCPIQLPNKSFTLRGITQTTEKSTLWQPHNEGVNYPYSPQILHKQHHSITIIFIFRKLSKVKIFPKAAIHTKKTTLGGALTFKILFQRKMEIARLDNT
jgi:hypothetical protein